MFGTGQAGVVQSGQHVLNIQSSHCLEAAWHVTAMAATHVNVWTTAAAAHMLQVLPCLCEPTQQHPLPRLLPPKLQCRVAVPPTHTRGVCREGSGQSNKRAAGQARDRSQGGRGFLQAADGALGSAAGCLRSLPTQLAVHVLAAVVKQANWTDSMHFTATDCGS